MPAPTRPEAHGVASEFLPISTLFLGEMTLLATLCGTPARPVFL